MAARVVCYRKREARGALFFLKRKGRRIRRIIEAGSLLPLRRREAAEALRLQKRGTAGALASTKKRDGGDFRAVFLLFASLLLLPFSSARATDKEAFSLFPALSRFFPP